GDFAGEPDQLVGRVAHRREDTDHATSGLTCSDEPARDVLDLLRAADRRPAELHHDQVAPGRHPLGCGVGRKLRDALELRARHMEKHRADAAARPPRCPRYSSMTVVRRPPCAPKPPQADQKISESRMPTAPTISRIHPIVFSVVAKSRTAPAAISSRLTLMPMWFSSL